MRRAVPAFLLAIAAMSCGGETAQPRTLHVSAAASLTEAFSAIGARFERHSDTDVTFNFAASSALAKQIAEGAEVDVFASADEANMTKLIDADLVEAPVVFVQNRLAIVAPKDNPAAIDDLTDLARGDVVVVLCNSEVPCGRYADEALAKAGASIKNASREENVKAVVTKVALGEADAGIVYASDVLAAGDDVTGIQIPEDQNVVASYPIAAVKGTRTPDAARAFVRFVRSREARTILERFGFVLP